MKNNSTVVRIISIVLGVLVIGLLLAFALGLFSGNKEISYTQFVDKMESGKVSAVHVKGSYVAYVKYTDSSVRRFPSQYDAFFYLSDRRDFDETVDAYNKAITDELTLKKELGTITAEQYEVMRNSMLVNLSYNNPSTGAMLSSILPILLIGGLLVFALFLSIRQANSMNSKAMQFGNSRAQMVRSSKVRFSDVAGAEEEKEELKEVVDFLSNPAKYTKVGARIPKGVLLVGPPGTGKTLFAKAVAGEAGVPFFSLSGSDFVEVYVGVGASRVRDLFAQAKKVMPCIVFIDEIDAVGRQRGAGLGGGNDEREQTLNQLLVQMDGFDANDGIIIMAATNRADVLDPALLRAGRFDRQIFVNVPDVKGRQEIARVHARNKPLSGDIDFATIASLTVGFTGADIENLLNEAAILAARNNRSTIIMDDILEGINKTIMGPQKKSRVITPVDRRITAYHESGHAIIARVLDNCDEVQEVSIIPRGSAAGYTLTRPDVDDMHVSKGRLMDTITMMLGGRAAEEIVIQDVTTGASSDIQRATNIARSMVTEWGMSDLGCIYLGGDTEVFVGKSWGRHSDISDDMSARIDEAVRGIIETCYQRALTILREHRSIMDKMVRALFDKETIFKADVDAIFAEEQGLVAQENAMEGVENVPVVVAEESVTMPTSDTVEHDGTDDE